MYRVRAIRFLVLLVSVCIAVTASPLRAEPPSPPSEFVRLEVRVLELTGETTSVAQEFRARFQEKKDDTSKPLSDGEGIDPALRRASLTKGLKKVSTCFQGVFTVPQDVTVIIDALDEKVTKTLHLLSRLDRDRGTPAPGKIGLEILYSAFVRQDYHTIAFSRTKTARGHMVLDDRPACIVMGDEEDLTRQVLVVDAHRVRFPFAEEKIFSGSGLVAVGVRWFSGKADDPDDVRGFTEDMNKAVPGDDLDGVISKSALKRRINKMSLMFGMDLAVQWSTPVKVLVAKGEAVSTFDFRADMGPEPRLFMGYYLWPFDRDHVTDTGRGAWAVDARPEYVLGESYSGTDPVSKKRIAGMAGVLLLKTHVVQDK